MRTSKSPRPPRGLGKPSPAMRIISPRANAARNLARAASSPESPRIISTPPCAARSGLIFKSQRRSEPRTLKRKSGCAFTRSCTKPPAKAPARGSRKRVPGAVFRRDDQLINLRAVGIGGIVDAHFARRAAQKIFQPQINVLRNVPLDFCRARFGGRFFGRVKFAVVSRAPFRVAQNFMRRVQFLRARDGGGRMRI